MRKVRKLNVQGLARRDKRLMSCLLSEPSMTTASIDLSAGEPTVTAHFSQDKRYRYATVDGVGKSPYYGDDGVLYIDDIYLMTMSKSPIAETKMREVFNTTFNGKTFQEQWLEDSDVIAKGELKRERAMHKWMCLGLGYSMGPKKLVEQAYDSGEVLSLSDAKKFFKVYWQIFEGVKDLATRLEKRLLRDGYLVNPFGYRCVPDKSYKALNYFIQSSVSGIVHALGAKLMSAAPWSLWKSCIHDELLVDFPSEREAEFKAMKELATDSLNEDLNWTVKVRTGFVTGRTWYEAK